MKKIKRLPLVAIVLVLYTFVFYSKAYSNIIPKYIIVDDYKATSNYRQWYYSRIGTDRGKMGSGNQSVTIGGGYASVSVNSGWAGVWTRLMHTSSENDLISPTKLLGSYVKDKFQPKISGVEIDILDGIGSFKIELKGQNGQILHSKMFSLGGGTITLTFNVSPTNELKELNWLLDGSGSVTVDEVRFVITAPSYKIEEAVFLFTYGHLCQCFDEATGYVRDRARWPVNDFTAVQSIGMFALASAIAYDLGYIQYTDAHNIVTKTKNALLTIPKYKSLLPHFLKNGEIVPNTEWSTIDTIIALVSEIIACHSFEIETSDLENLLINIDWSDLTENQTHSIRMGYDYNKVKLPNSWDTFGSEAFLSAVVYSASTNGLIARLDNQQNTPTWDGSGFNDELAALFFPMYGQDIWGNDWIKYRSDAFDKQRSYFSGHIYQNLGLFGLSASEVPEKWAIANEDQHYSAWGVGGHNTTPNDGTALVGYPIIAPHYAALVSLEQNEYFRALFKYLISELSIFTPLNNVESFGINSLHWNSLKGSWNLSLQALGVARALSGYTYLPYRIIKENDFLCKGYSRIINEITLGSTINVLKLLSGTDLSICEIKCANSIRDTKIDLKDVIFILQYLSGLRDTP